MARYNFGGSLADFAILPPSGQSNVVKSQPNVATGTAWSASTGGTQYTDMLISGVASAVVRTDSNGFVTRFQGPDGVTELWADFGGGTRFHVWADDGPVDKKSTGVNVRDFGAVGDGTTDDSSAIRTALALAKTVHLPRGGTFLVSQHSSNAWCLSLSAGQRLVSDGATVKMANSQGVGVSVIRPNGNGARVEGIVIDGNRANQSVEAQKQRHGIYIDQVTDVVIRDVEVKECAGDGVLIYRTADRTEIVGARIHDTDRNGISWAGDSDYVVVDRCAIWNVTTQPIDGEVENVGAAFSEGSRVTNNLIIAPSGGYAITTATVSTSTRNKNWVIADNSIYGSVTLLRSTGTRLVGNSITVQGGTLPAVTASITRDTLIHGNLIDTTAVTTAPGVTAEFTLSVVPTALTITNNTIRAGKDGMSLRGVQQVRVAGNTVIGSGTASANGIGFQAITTTRDVSIDNNTILNFNLTAVDVSTFSTNTVDGLTVRGNTFRDDQGSPTMTRGVRLTGTASQFSGIDIRDNVSASTVTTPFSDATTGAPVVLTRNSGGSMRETQGSAAPTAGTWAVGDRCWNTAPAAGGTPGWVCTTAGSPGTWKAMANVAA